MVVAERLQENPRDLSVLAYAQELGVENGELLESKGWIGTWRFPKIIGTCLGDPITRIVELWGLYWGPPIKGNYH